MNLLYTGPFLDSSGYAQFARNFIMGLDELGVNLQTRVISFESQQSNLGVVKDKILSLSSNKLLKCDAHIINVTPEHYPKLMVSGTKNIGFTMFETTRIPDLWVKECNKMDAIFVPCKWNVQVFQESGVTVPVKVVPGGIHPEEASVALEMLGALKDKYKFYSIFQWTERKNPVGLLRAYYAAFTGRDDVVLVLKTYGNNTSESEQQRIKRLIQHVKDSMRLKSYPPVLFIGNLLSTSELRQLHEECDCFVLPHRAEGFGMPHLEAMSCGNPIITTGFSGNMEFCNDSNSYLLDYTLTPVSGMSWIPWYEGDMFWAEPSLHDLVELMRYVVKYPEEAKAIGKKGQETVLTQFNWKECSKKLVTAVEELL